MAAIVDTRQASLLCIQEVQLLQRDRATLRIIEYFAKSLKMHLRSFETTQLRRACVSPY